MAAGNLAVELELTNQMRQPSLERAQETLAAIEARPAPTPAQMEHNELLHRYRAAGSTSTLRRITFRRWSWPPAH